MSFPRVAAATMLSLTCLGATLTATGAVAASVAVEPTPTDRLTPAAQSFTRTDRNTSWALVDKLALDFPTYHPQGFALVGNRIFMSSVEVLEAPVKYPQPVGVYDRSTGRGVGHVFVMTRSGKLLKDIVIGESSMYHPGGMDYDGTSVWVPAAEYRPESRSIVYRIDPKTYKVTEAFRYDDHVGGVVNDQATGQVAGVSWGSRQFFNWTPRGRLLGRSANPDHLIDYQDCDYAGDRHQLCSGITALPTATGDPYELGGLALTSLVDNKIKHAVPFPKFSTADHVVTRNPVALEQDGDTLRLFAAPDDGEEASGTELLIYESHPGA